MKVKIIQPALASYRTSFFDGLSQRFDITVLYSKIDFLGVKSQEQNTSNFNRVVLGKFYTLFNKIYWQKGLSIFGFTNEDVVIIPGNPRVINYMLLFFVCKMKGIKVIWWGQGWTGGSFGKAAKVRRKLMSLSDGIALYTEKEAEEFLHTSKHSNVIGLNNGLDIKAIQRENVYSNNNSISKVLEIVFIGRLTKKSNIELLLQSMVDCNDNIRLIVIGDGDCKQGCIEFVQKNNISEKVVFLGPMFSEKDIAKSVKSCSYFVYPGSVGLSLIHGFAYGLPAIVHSNKLNHMPEFDAFEEGVNGLTFTENSKDSLVNLLNILCEQDIDIMSQNALRTVEDTFNTDDMIKRMTRLVLNTYYQKGIN